MATTTEYVECPASAIPAGVRFDTRRRDQGQIVEVNYGTFDQDGAGPGDPYMQVVDKSIPRGEPGHVTYYRTPAEADRIAEAAAKAKYTI